MNIMNFCSTVNLRWVCVLYLVLLPWCHENTCAVTQVIIKCVLLKSERQQSPGPFGTQRIPLLVLEESGSGLTNKTD